MLPCCCRLLSPLRTVPSLADAPIVWRSLLLLLVVVVVVVLLLVASAGFGAACNGDASAGLDAADGLGSRTALITVSLSQNSKRSRVGCAFANCFNPPARRTAQANPPPTNSFHLDTLCWPIFCSKRANARATLSPVRWSRSLSLPPRWSLLAAVLSGLDVACGLGDGKAEGLGVSHKLQRLRFAKTWSPHFGQIQSPGRRVVTANCLAAAVPCRCPLLSPLRTLPLLLLLSLRRAGERDGES